MLSCDNKWDISRFSLGTFCENIATLKNVSGFFFGGDVFFQDLNLFQRGISQKVVVHEVVEGFVQACHDKCDRIRFLCHPMPLAHACPILSVSNDTFESSKIGRCLPSFCQVELIVSDPFCFVITAGTRQTRKVLMLASFSNLLFH